MCVCVCFPSNTFCNAQQIWRCKMTGKICFSAKTTRRHVNDAPPPCDGLEGPAGLGEPFSPLVAATAALVAAAAKWSAPAPL